MSAIEKAVKLLRREAESMKECHTIGVNGEWYGDWAKADYDEIISSADAAIAERDELRNALQCPLDALPSATTHPCDQVRPRSNRPRHRRKQMTPTKTTTILRQFNEWQRGHNTVLRPSSNELGEAIDAAVEMIERLEAAEKSDAESIAMYRRARDERDALRAKVERMERDLRLIAETDPVDAALDPQRSVRIARAALEELK